MNDLYKRIQDLCEGSGLSITEMCRQSGASRGSLGDLSKGRIKTLSPGTLSKISSFFNVSVDYLLGVSKNEKSPAPEGAERLSVDELLDRLSQAELVELMAKTAAKLKERGLE